MDGNTHLMNEAGTSKRNALKRERQRFRREYQDYVQEELTEIDQVVHHNISQIGKAEPRSLFQQLKDLIISHF